MSRNTLLFVALLNAALAFCPSTSPNSPSRKLCFTLYNWPKPYAQAENFCKSYGGHLASVNDAFEAQLITQEGLAQGVPSAFWIGASDYEKPGQYTWQDGTPFTYVRWDGGQPNTSLHCVSTLISTGKWATAACTKALPFACVAPLQQQCVAPCQSGWTWYQKTSSCYKVNHDLKQWADAESTCQEEGAHLTSIHSDDENAFVNTLARTGVTMEVKFQVFIGLQRTSNGQFAWVDGTPTDYFHWSDGEPNNKGGKEHCVETYADVNYPKEKGDYEQRWNDCECSLDMRASVCKKPANPY